MKQPPVARSQATAGVLQKEESTEVGWGQTMQDLEILLGLSICVGLWTRGVGAQSIRHSSTGAHPTPQQTIGSLIRAGTLPVTP